MPRIDSTKLVAAYRAGESLEAIARRFKIAHSTVAAHLQRAGEPMRPKGRPRSAITECRQEISMMKTTPARSLTISALDLVLADRQRHHMHALTFIGAPPDKAAACLICGDTFAHEGEASAPCAGPRPRCGDSALEPVPGAVPLSVGPIEASA